MVRLKSWFRLTRFESCLMIFGLCSMLVLAGQAIITRIAVERSKVQIVQSELTRLSILLSEMLSPVLREGDVKAARELLQPLLQNDDSGVTAINIVSPFGREILALGEINQNVFLRDAMSGQVSDDGSTIWAHYEIKHQGVLLGTINLGMTTQPFRGEMFIINIAHLLLALLAVIVLPLLIRIWRELSNREQEKTLSLITDWDTKRLEHIQPQQSYMLSGERLLTLIELCKRQQERLKDFFETTTEALFILDADGRCQRCNQAARALIGIESESLIRSQSLIKWFSHTESQYFDEGFLQRDIHEALGKSNAFDYEELILHVGKGKPKRVACHYRPFDVATSTEAGILCCRDISEQQEIRERLSLTAQVFESTQEGIMITDVQSRVLAVNKAFTAITGYTAEEIEGQFPDVLSSGIHGQDFYKDMWDSLTMKGSWQGQIWNKNKEGKLFPEWLSISEIRNQRDEVINYIAVFSDISVLINQETEIGNQNRLLRNILDNLNDGVLVLDLNGNILQANLHAYRVLGLSPDAESIHQWKSGRFIVENGELYDEGEPILQALQEHVIWDKEYRLERQGHTAFISINAKPLYNNSGGHIGALVVLRDISQTKQAHAKLLQAVRDAQAANQAKSDFLASMSHEIRTPMNGIIGVADILADSPGLGEDEHQLVDIIKSSGELLLSIVNDVLDFSKLDAGKLKLSQEPFNVGQLVQASVQVVEGQARQKGLECRFEAVDCADDWVVGDLQRCRQILVNLLGNAVKFTDKGFVSLSVMQMRKLGQVAWYRFTVEDSGIGVDESFRPYLFTRFAQADTSSTRRFGGTGLGLAICRRLVDQMGGYIDVDSVPGKGSRFWFEIPLPVREGQRELGRATDDMAFSASYRILVAEDNHVNQAVIARMLEKMQLQVDMVANGEEAVRAWQHSRYDLILMDWRMPILDGLEATRRIRSLEESDQHMIIVALTANSSVEDRQTCIEAGMDDFLPKPVKYEQLRDVLYRHLETGAQTSVQH